MTVGPWRQNPCPSDAPGVRAIWWMAEQGSAQHPLAVRALWDGDRVLAVGGVVQMAVEEGYAFFWKTCELSMRAWRLIWPTVSSMAPWAHQRKLRVINAVVAADHVEGHRMIRRLGYEPYGPAPAFAGLKTPMLRYLHIWPSVDEPVLVRHQRYELWLACLAAWCPAYHAEALKELG
jgi:hypothetical protein